MNEPRRQAEVRRSNDGLATTLKGISSDPRRAVGLGLGLLGLVVLLVVSTGNRQSPSPIPPSSTEAPVSPEQLQGRTRPKSLFGFMTGSEEPEAAPAQMSGIEGASVPMRLPELRRPRSRKPSLSVSFPAPPTRLVIGDPSSEMKGRMEEEGSEVRLSVKREPVGLVLKRGYTLHARLERAVDSNSFESAVVARLTHSVYDTEGRLIFPEQTGLYGIVSADPVLGSNRVGILWHEAILPASWGSRRVPLLFPGSDGAGIEGAETDVSFRWASFYGHAALTSVLSALAQAAEEPGGSGNARFSDYAAGGFASRSEEVTRSVTDQLLNRRPRFRMERGERIAVQVTKSMEVIYG